MYSIWKELQEQEVEVEVEGEGESVPLVEDEGESVPVVEWEHVSDTQPLTQGSTGEVRSATLRLSSGREVPVVLKLNTWSLTPLTEALVVQALAGVPGVPTLYGVTRTHPRILMMGWCPGISVKELWMRGEVRACLTALLHLCPILSQMQERRVCHRNLRAAHNILFDAAHTDGDARVYLIGFTSARTRATTNEMEADQHHLQRLVTDILIDMDKTFDPDVFKQRDEALGYLCEPLHLRGIRCVLHKLLYPHST